MTQYVIKNHSGKSAYRFRVMAIYSHNGRKISHQLVKCKTREDAERNLEHFKSKGSRQ